MLRKQKKSPSNKLAVFLLYICFLVCAVVFFYGCKTPEQLVIEADTDSYDIIEEKWQDDFGEMVNYQIRDDVADVNEILAEVPSSGVLSLAKAVEIATKYSRQYQSQRESLYNSALGLTLTRHNYARQ